MTNFVDWLRSGALALNHARVRERELAERAVAAKERIAAALEKNAASQLDAQRAADGGE